MSTVCAASHADVSAAATGTKTASTGKLPAMPLQTHHQSVYYNPTCRHPCWTRLHNQRSAMHQAAVTLIWTCTVASTDYKLRACDWATPHLTKYRSLSNACSAMDHAEPRQLAAPDQLLLLLTGHICFQYQGSCAAKELQFSAAAGLAHSSMPPCTLAHFARPEGSRRHVSMAFTALRMDAASPFSCQ